MSTIRNVIRVVVAGLLGLAALAFVVATPVIWLAILDPFGGSAHPSDAALLAQFAAKRHLLEQLVDLIEHDDGLVRVAPDFIRPEDAAGTGSAPRRWTSRPNTAPGLRARRIRSARTRPGRWSIAPVDLASASSPAKLS